MRPGRLTGAVGRLLLCVGTVILLFVAYQLWGTGLAENHSQAVLRTKFDNELRSSDTITGSVPKTTDPTTTQPGGRGTPESAQPAPTTPPPAEGQPVGLLEIPKIGVDKVIVEGTSTTDLRQGPGQYGIAGQGPVTPLPGQAGNAGIAGHRTTYGAPFYNLNELVPGDPIVVTTTQGVFTYDVTKSLTVSPSDGAVMAQSSVPELTLTTCTPRFQASNRLVVQATLVRSKLTAAATKTPTSTTEPSTGGTGGARRQAVGTTDGLAGSQGDWVPALWWGAGVLAAGLMVGLVARRRTKTGGRVLVYGAGGVGVLVVLFFFFGALSPLLPASF
jgi:sortase A